MNKFKKGDLIKFRGFSNLYCIDEVTDTHYHVSNDFRSIKINKESDRLAVPTDYHIIEDLTFRMEQCLNTGECDIIASDDGISIFQHSEDLAVYLSPKEAKELYHFIEKYVGGLND